MESTPGGAALTPPSALRPQPGSERYMQLAMYLAANALTVVVGLLLWNLNTVLADFRDSMLWALLCSIALRPVKDWAVQHVERSLADPRRSVAGALLGLAALPLTTLVDAWQEGRAILAKWRQAVQEEWMRRQAQLKRGAVEAAATAQLATPASPRTPRTAAAAAASSAAAARTSGLPTGMPSLAVYGHAAVRVLKSRRTSKKRRKQRQQQRQRAPEGSSVLFRWLFRTCAAWLAWEWVRDSWSATVQLVLLVFTAVVVLGVVPLLLLTTRSYLNSTVFSPVKTPTAAATQGTVESRRRGNLQVLSPPQQPRFSPFSEGRSGRAATPATPGDAAAAGAAWWSRWRAAWREAKAAARSVLSSLEAGLRSTLRANLHALVSLLLILGLFVGTTGLAAFLSVRVAQEGRATVLAVRDVFPAAWAGMAASTPLLAEVGAAAGGGGGGQALAAGAAVLPAWVASYQQEALQLAQQALPAIASWAEAQFYGLVEKQNLTAALGDIRLLYETIHGPRQCSEREREKLVVAVARAEVALQAARDAKAATAQQLGDRRGALRAAVAALEAARQPAEPARPAPAAHCDTPTADFASGGAAASECGPEGQGAGPGEVPLSEQVLALEATVVAADTALKGAKAAHKAAAKALDAAEREQRAAQSRLQLCSVERHAQHQGSLLPGLAGEIGSSLQRAYAKLWRRQFREGLRDMRGAVAHLLAALRGIAQRGSDAVADLGSLQRLAHAAADPLIAVGRVAGRLFAGSVGSTTAAALMGGLGVLRLGMGVVKLGMQLMLFLALLYYLLAARGDPLLAAVGVLPVSEHGRQRAAVALNRALGGVLISAMKLIAFHGCFSFITFRVMGLPLTYTASVASAVCALLPFVPTYAVALPGCVVLLAQGRLLAAPLFFGLHFMGYYVGDTAILEDIPGGHPYMLSLGILGGIYAFENPLQGCLLGPILLSLLSVFYNLHSEFMGGGASGLASDGRPLHRLWSLTPIASAAKQQAQQQQQQRVRLSDVPPAAGGAGGRPGTASPEQSASLRIQVPSRQEGGYYSSGPLSGGEASPLPQAPQPEVRRRPSPAAAAAVGAAGGQEEQDQQGEQQEQGTSGGESGSVGNSFSFFGGALGAAGSGKLHDD